MLAALRLLSLRHDIMVAKMAHRRIRKFNTKHTYPEQNLDNDLAQAVVTQGGKIVWLRGQCAQNLDDAVSIDSHDPVQQTHKVMQNMRQLIEEAGGKMEHLVKIVVYITDIRHREAVYRTMGEYIKGVHPVSTGLVVQALARPEWLVEIDGTAVIPD
jgi:enamine deaminase RidA (YjgF/YER057c/UK114 family)